MVEITVNGKIYIVEFLRKARRHYEYFGGKTTTIVTQCMIKEKGGLYIGGGETVKDSRDKDNELIGKRVALKYALTDEPRAVRKAFWKQLKLEKNDNN